MKLTIFTDGASRGNPGPAAYGFTISDEKGLLYEEGGFIGTTTNNVAEYTGLVEALRYVKENFSTKLPLEVKVFMDSLLLVMQINGKYKIKASHLKTYLFQIKESEGQIGRVSYAHVPRNKNTIADRLANQALDKRGL